MSQLTQFGSADSINMNFADTNGVNSYQADVTIHEVTTNSASPRARLVGNFYNTGTPGGGEAGEVFVVIQIRDVGGGFGIEFFVETCNNPDCSDVTELIFDGTTFGSVNLNETHTLSIEWDGTQFFTFGVDGATVQFDAAAVAPVAGPSKSSSFKSIGTRISGIGGPDEGGHIKASFDNVIVTDGTVLQVTRGSTSVAVQTLP